MREIIEGLNASDRLGTAFTDQEIQILRNGGMQRTCGPAVGHTARVRAVGGGEQTAAETTRYLALAMSEGDILKRLARRRLYAIETYSVPRLPMFQFHDGKPLPKFEEVEPVIRGDLHPLAVFEWFTELDVDLFINDDIDQTRRDPYGVIELTDQMIYRCVFSSLFSMISSDTTK